MSAIGGDRLDWKEATVEEVVVRTPSVKSFFLRPPDWPGFLAGQHVDIRLTAPDGYRAERSYSIGSAPGADTVELVIEKLDNGEVSPFFHDVVVPGDSIEMRGPIGGHFNWRPSDGGPLLLIGGGSGVVPLMSMARLQRLEAPSVRTILIYSARHLEDVIFREELLASPSADSDFSLILTLTREPTPPPGVHAGRLDMKLMDGVLAMFGTMPRQTFVCGSSAFVDVATMLLIDAGIPFGSIRTERFGGDPAGGDLHRQPVPEE